MNKNMTTHELAKKLLSLPDVPVYHMYTYWGEYDDAPMEYKYTAGINLLHDNNILSEVAIYGEELVSTSSIDYDLDV